MKFQSINTELFQKAQLTKLFSIKGGAMCHTIKTTQTCCEDSTEGKDCEDSTTNNDECEF